MSRLRKVVVILLKKVLVKPMENPHGICDQLLVTTVNKGLDCIKGRDQDPNATGRGIHAWISSVIKFVI